jgi:7,8-dihydropterin-6-yl-methyl-4-(beta-D-ribofuranosyl)aminobenzene 5'-phosphate synthase
MRISVLVDDVVEDGATPVHGFSAIVEGTDALILFDTGPDGEVLMTALDREGVDVRDLDMVLISHAHRDHSGGLARVLYDHPRLPVSVPMGAASEISRMVPRNAVLTGEDGPRPLAEHISTTGDLGDGVPEQAIVLETDRGIVVLTGCGHPGLRALVDAVGGSAFMVVGGVHDLTVDDLPFPGVGGMVVCHCTPMKRVLSHRFPQVVLAGTGFHLELDPPPEPSQMPRS